MTIYATNGSKLYIGAALPAKSTDFVAADFTPQTWVEIGEIEALGTLGDAATEISFDAISTSRTRRLKGTRNAGSMEVVAGLDYDDPGQLAVIAAEKTPHDYAFRLVLNDAPPGGTPSERLFVAKVASAAEALDGANSVMKLNMTLWVNSNVVKVDADAA
ncbi:hypothetical protein [Paracoccus sp. MC1862]|uniref:hypothetical protein n=1 Tax=Paracoccus sp. MC1862 TaxID=2760307 RepID=UPI00160350AD|nr:hypothetical protein [Paracoccus sp. MC1862]MBB1498468.1 hypothetical protein [Paracoccus sp. MC1862]QQO43820.1 hypothetical protein JGR78_10300 [Paracoccus sp. MC1862]